MSSYFIREDGNGELMTGRDVPAPIASLLDITKIESLPPDERNKYDSNMQNEFDPASSALLSPSLSVIPSGPLDPINS